MQTGEAVEMRLPYPDVLELPLTRPRRIVRDTVSEPALPLFLYCPSQSQRPIASLRRQGTVGRDRRGLAVRSRDGPLHGGVASEEVGLGLGPRCRRRIRASIPIGFRSCIGILRLEKRYVTHRTPLPALEVAYENDGVRSDYPSS